VTKEVSGDQIKRVHPLVVAFVVYHVITITLGALPKPSEQVLSGLVEPRGSDSILKYNHEVIRQHPLVYGYLDSTGFWQYWDMFAPNPVQVDLWMDAEVVYKDGTRTIFSYPRMFTEPLVQKYIKERYRKLYERIDQEKYSFLWSPAAQRIAYLNADNPTNPPLLVNLRRHFQFIKRHETPSAPQAPYTMYKYYTHVVNLPQLFKDKGWQSNQEWKRGKR
jgi:hypothetical protein